VIRPGRSCIVDRPGLDAAPVERLGDRERAGAHDVERDQRDALSGGGRAVAGQAVDRVEGLERLGGQGPGVPADACLRLLDGVVW
jgi:hypothetical protein